MSSMLIRDKQKQREHDKSPNSPHNGNKSLRTMRCLNRVVTSTACKSASPIVDHVVLTTFRTYVSRFIIPVLRAASTFMTKIIMSFPNRAFPVVDDRITSPAMAQIHIMVMRNPFAAYCDCRPINSSENF